MTKTKTKVSITTRLTGDTTTCRFNLDQPIHDGEAAFFRSKEDASKSALASQIFALGDIERIKIGKDIVTVTRTTPEDWPKVTRKVAEIITDLVDSGKPAVEAGAPSNMHTPEEITEILNKVLDAEINPAVASHGGEISILEVKGTTVYVKLGGGCQGCGQASVTLKQGVEKAFFTAIPELDEVLDITDHAGGTNPYYAPSTK